MTRNCIVGESRLYVDLYVNFILLVYGIAFLVYVRLAAMFILRPFADWVLYRLKLRRSGLTFQADRVRGNITRGTLTYAFLHDCLLCVIFCLLTSKDHLYNVIEARCSRYRHLLFEGVAKQVCRCSGLAISVSLTVRTFRCFNLCVINEGF